MTCYRRPLRVPVEPTRLRKLQAEGLSFRAIAHVTRLPVTTIAYSLNRDEEAA